MRMVVAVGVIVGLLGLRSHASAQGAGQAESLFREGTRLRDAGKFAEACEAFVASQRLEASVATLMNIGNCREKNGELASAWDAFLGVVRDTRDDATQAKLHQVAKARAAAIEPRLSYLTINVADEVRIDGLEVLLDDAVLDTAAWNKSLPIDGGSHVVSGRAPGHEIWSTTVTVEPEHDKASVEVPRFKEIREPDEPEVRPAIIAEPEASDRSGGLTGKRKLALGIGAVALASFGAAVAFELSGQSTFDEYDRAPEAPMRDDLYDAANRKHHLAQGFAVAGLLGAGAATFLWLTGGASHVDRATAVRPLLMPAFAGVAITGWF